MKEDIRPAIKSGFKEALYVTAVLAVVILMGVLSACKTTPEKIRADADKINNSIDAEQARANQDIDDATEIGKAAKESAESIIDNVEESVNDVIDNVKDSAEAVKEH